jgi:hypothetical protein
MPSKGKKGQAALEYLLTYGWAILIIAAVIAIIIGSGMFSPKNSAANYAVSPPQMPVNGFMMTGESGDILLKVNLSNNFGYKIRVDGITVTYRDGTKFFDKSDTLAQGDSRIYTFTLSEMDSYPGRGTTARVDLKVDLTNCYGAVNPDCMPNVGGTSATSTIPVYIIGYVE